MKKYVLAIAIASGALFGLSAQAAPISPSAPVAGQVTGSAVKVWHHWHRWHHWHHWHRWGHGRHWSHRRWGSWH